MSSVLLSVIKFWAVSFLLYFNTKEENWSIRALRFVNVTVAAGISGVNLLPESWSSGCPRRAALRWKADFSSYTPPPSVWGGPPALLHPEDSAYEPAPLKHNKQRREESQERKVASQTHTHSLPHSHRRRRLRTESKHQLFPNLPTQQTIKLPGYVKPSLMLWFNFCPNCECEDVIKNLNLYQMSPTDIKTKFCLNRGRLLWVISSQISLCRFCLLLLFKYFSWDHTVRSW